MNATEELMRGAAAEIRQLRRDNELLRAKVDMVELFATVLYTKPAMPSHGESVDVAWALDKAAGEEAEREKAGKAP